MVEDLLCPVCLSVLLFDMSNSLGWRYECALSNDRHYLGYLTQVGIFDEESIVLTMNGKKYTITQYNEPPIYDLVIVCSDEEGHYEYSKELSFKEPPFDFLHNDMDQTVKRLKTILTFR